MNLLVVTPQLPYPPRQGTTIRNYNLIRGLAQRHEVDLLTFLAPGEALTADSPLWTLCRRVAGVNQPERTLRRRALATLTTRTPDMGLRLESPAMHALIASWTQERRYDAVQIEGIELAQYGLAVAGRRRHGRHWPALIFDDHNCEYLLQQRNAFTDLRHPRRWPAAAYSLIQWQKLRHYEAAVMRGADAVVAVSAADRAALQRLGAASSITVVSNGIDVTHYQPLAPAPPPAPTIVFTGKMDYRPNIDAVLWFAQQVLPRILAQAPAARFQIVGMNPHARLDVLRANPAIEITGAVPDTRPYLQRAGVYVIPMRVGGGTRFKALEAMACAAPIVSTTLGVEGIGVRNGQEMLLADTPEEFAIAVLRVLADAAGNGVLRRQLGAQGRRFVETRYAWEAIIPHLENVLITASQ
ncbi:MAG TPA: glycosyl transferase family 1 [Chloroflexi bacterium]|nr:glycosyl transferase family 1 [Chloroflexota bacterium]HHW88515.1 glycosyltransferase [Chloroflexota bacterium]